MSRVLNYVPRVAFFLVGVAAAAITLPRRERGGMDSVAADELKRSLAGLEARLRAREAADAARFAEVEIRLEEHASRLRDVPSTGQIVAAMEQFRLTKQAHSIEVLKTTVSQTDSLLERVLESLDSLQTFQDPVEMAEDPLLSNARV
ncbi:MAG: hypothetical protein NTW28_30825 [Candidatus Solibacter sp.]|nr:hypothetical protein [Candidatus Solibacter sp.]